MHGLQSSRFISTLNTISVALGLLAPSWGFAQPASQTPPPAAPTPAGASSLVPQGSQAPTPAPAGAASPAATGGAAPSGQTPSRPVAVPGAPCLIAEFRTLALDTHDPTERERVIRQWLRTNLRGCALDKLALIGSNRAAWLGTADSPLIMGKIDTAIEAKVQDNPALLSQLFDAMPRSFTPSVETFRTEPAQPILGPQGGGFGFVAPMGVINIRP